MWTSEVSRRIGFALLGADVDKDGCVNHSTHCVYLDLTVSDHTLILNHSIPLTDLTPGTTYYYRAICGTTVRASFSLGQHE
jgi:hypothetical protein